jgi:large subunit ribosomal protein L9
MKVLLVKDVYKLGRAGDVKKVADGYGRNFLLPHTLAVLATPGALKQVDRLREQAAVRRAAQNEELSGIAGRLNSLVLAFAAKAGETGKLYGSITSQDVAEAIEKKTGFPAKRQQMDMQPIRSLGEHIARLRLTMDLIPEIKVAVYREGEADPTQPHPETPTAPVTVEPPVPASPQASPEIVEAEAEVVETPAEEAPAEPSALDEGTRADEGED